MATPTRPCPYCGAAVLMNAPACGTCGRPMPPMQAGAPPQGNAPAKTMFGYAAPQIPGRPQATAPGQAPQQQGFAPPQQQGFAPPQAQPRPSPQQGYQQPGYPPQPPQGQPGQPGYPGQPG